MFCSNCGEELQQRTGNCGNCGQKVIKKRRTLPILLTLLTLFIISGFLIFYFQSSQLTHTALPVIKKELPEKQTLDFTTTKEEPKAIPHVDVADIIQEAQTKVFTIFTSYGQGSGFLIDDKGHVLTNAHVVEGELYPIIRKQNGEEYEGKIIGYSNTTDIAVIQVSNLKGSSPLSLEENSVEIGEEVIALGSPQGYENTATLGHISGVNRNFVISPFTYEGVYQTSAPIAPGNSGGPLLSKKTGKVVAINSARDEREMNIGFSIPIHRILSTVNQWIASPMTEDDIYSLFYYSDDFFYFGDYLDDYGYFDDYGYYSDEYEYYDYYYYDEYDWYDWYDEDYYYDYDFDYEDYYYEYEDYYYDESDSWYWEDDDSYEYDDIYEDEFDYDPDEYNLESDTEEEIENDDTEIDIELEE